MQVGGYLRQLCCVWVTLLLIVLSTLYPAKVLLGFDPGYHTTLHLPFSRLYDVPESELLKHWNKTYKFIKEAKYVCY